MSSGPGIRMGMSLRLPLPGLATMEMLFSLNQEQALPVVGPVGWDLAVKGLKCQLSPDSFRAWPQAQG